MQSRPQTSNHERSHIEKIIKSVPIRPNSSGTCMTFPIRSIWNIFIDLSESHIDKIYNRLGLFESVSTYGAYKFPEIKKKKSGLIWKHIWLRYHSHWYILLKRKRYLGNWLWLIWYVMKIINAHVCMWIYYKLKVYNACFTLFYSQYFSFCNTNSMICHIPFVCYISQVFTLFQT